MNPRRLLPAAVAAALGVLCLWSYWPTLCALAARWVKDPEYSHGYLVPAFAVLLLWLRRDRLRAPAAGSATWGLALLLAGGAFRVLGAWLYIDWLEAAALLPTVAGLFALFGGRPALTWAWPAVAFLGFMIPLPYRIETALAQPLQGLATTCSAYAMQTLGLPAVAEGNTILLSRGRIGIVEACNGLSMLLVFFALAAAVALVIRRPALDRAVLLVSAIPVALLANVARITTTGVLQEWVDPQLAQRLFHDWGGWLMMPLALGVLWLELWALDRLLIPAAPARPLAVPLGLPAAGPALKGRGNREKGPGRREDNPMAFPHP
jgi:exosortase